MKNAENRLAALGAAVPDLLLPRGKDLSKWAVVACDQWTQDRGYWEQVSKIVGESPSTLNLIFPEIYLEDPGQEERIASIHNAMRQYLDTDVFTVPEKTLVYVERDTPYNQSRKGIVIALDLELYDWKTDISPLPMIRPSEGTVTERLPPRMEIRRSAPLETPHILVLINDKENALLPALGEMVKNNTAIYDIELMLGSGRVQGWKLDTEEHWNHLADGLEKLALNAPFLYAVGDGNHSLATAKSIWEEYKNAHQHNPDIMNHPARWALIELVNLYDPALQFEPIHRALFSVDTAALQQALAKLPGYSCRKLGQAGDTADCSKELIALVQDEACKKLRLGLITDQHCYVIEADPVPLAVDVLQPLLDTLIDEQKKQNGKATIDYIHGSEELFLLASGKKSSEINSPITGILLPPFSKHGLFETIAKRGPLPRKSFSMGEACEKRFYLECRKLF